MLHRRDCLLGAIGTLAVGGTSVAAPLTEPIRAALKQTVGAREKVAGTVAVVFDESGATTVAYGNTDVPDVAMDLDAVFEIGSITKVMTALLLADMVSRGEIAIDDPVSKYLPVKLHERGRAITLQDLATYNSGLPKLPPNLPANWFISPNPFADYTAANFYGAVASYVPEYTPGSQFVYSSYGFALLGAALARRAGKSYETLLIERICDPLGLAHTRIMPSPDMRNHLVRPHDLNLKPVEMWNFSPEMQGMGAVRSTAGDMVLFAKACMGFAQTPLRRQLMRLTETRRSTNVSGTDAALGWFISSSGNDEIVWKTGLTAGCNTFIGFSTKNRRGAVVLSNFVWLPLDIGTTDMSMKLINADFKPGDLAPLYQ